MPRTIKSSQTAYMTTRYDHHSYLRSKFNPNPSGPVIQKLLQNLQTVSLRWFQGWAMPFDGIEKHFPHSIHLRDPSLTHQARWSNFIFYLRKEEWLINSTEITNCCHIIHIQPNFSFTNWEIITSELLTNKPKSKKRDKTVSTQLLMPN